MKFATTVHVDAPAEEVFASLSDFSRHVRRAESKGARIRVTDAPVFGWTAAFDWNGAARELKGEVVRIDPPRGFAAEMVAPGVAGTIDIEVLSLGSTRSQVRVAMEWRPLTIPGRLLLQSLKLVKGKLDDRFAARVAEIAGGTTRMT
jgi:uncharacterized protein YndB with AHSA1/START domain